MLHKKIVIVGGGPVGLSMALKLAKQGKSVTIIDKSTNKGADKRVLAMSYASHSVLEELGSWPKDATAIDCVQISHNGLGITNIFAKQLNLQHLGYTVEYRKLCESLLAKVDTDKRIEILEAKVTLVEDGTNFATVTYEQLEQTSQLLTCDLIIMAEGGNLLASKDKSISHNYEHLALVAHIKTREKPKGIAYERFSDTGALVLLPFKDHYVMVWSLETMQTRQLKDNFTELEDLLNKEFTRRLGGANIIGEIAAFPLRLIQAKQRMKKRIVLIGNSAQIVHPVSAQGLNLGLRDMATLGGLLAKSQDINIDDLKQFDSLREKDVNAVIGFTHSLTSFLDKPNIKHIRGAGIITLSNLPVVQNFIARSLIFGI